MVQSKANAKSLHKIKDENKDKNESKMCNTVIIDDFNIHYAHYIIEQPDLLNNCDVFYAPKFGDCHNKGCVFQKCIIM